MTFGNSFRTSTTVIIFAFLAILLIWTNLMGLERHIPIRDFQVDRWDTGDGLPGSQIDSIAQTQDGYLWIALSQGLVRYDGVRFVNVNIPLVDKTIDSKQKTIDSKRKTNDSKRKTIVISELVVDKNGLLWIGSSAGLTSYDCRTRQFETYQGIQGANREHLRRIYGDSSGSIWASFTTGDLIRFSKEKLSTIGSKQGLLGKKINAFLEDQKGQLYLGTREKGIFLFKDNACTPYPIPQLNGLFLVVMKQDYKGDLWLGTQQGLLRHNSGQTDIYQTNQGLSSDFVFSAFLEDSDKTLWVGTISGLNRLIRGPGNAITFESLLEDSAIFCLQEDNEKNLWVGTKNKGLLRIKDSKFATCPSLSAHAREKYSALGQGKAGRIWVGTLRGKIFCYQNGKIVNTIIKNNLSASIITAIAEGSDGKLWVGTNGKGVFAIDKNDSSQFTVKDGLAENTVTSICIDHQERIWFCTFGGLSVRYPDGTIKSLRVGDGFLHSRVLNIFEDALGDVWVATESGIILLEQGSIAAPQIITDFVGINVSSIYVELDPERAQGRLVWVTTKDTGLIRFEFPDRKMTTFTTIMGLPTNSIYQFFEDRDGFFWLLSAKGVLRLEKAELNRFAAGKTNSIQCVSLDKSDGLGSSEFDNQLSRHSVIKTGMDEYWLLTKNGIAILNPSKISVSKSPPPVVIEEIQVDGETVDWNPEGGGFSAIGARDVQFRFTAPIFNAPRRVRFRYRLIGYEKQWNLHPAKNQRVILYPSLSPGTYTFNVTASKGDGIWNKTGASYTFTLHAYFYQTLMFKIIFPFFLLVLLLGGGYIYKRDKELKKVKYKSSNMHPDFAQDCLDRLNKLMIKDKVYRDEDMSLETLAEKINVTRHQLSQLINEFLKMSFSDYINSFRISEAKEILSGPQGKKIKKSTLAHNIGFNTMAAFYKAFKKNTGLTPTQYQKQSEKGN